MMVRALAASSIGLLTFVSALSLMAFAVRKGLVSDDAVMLWANAISAGDYSRREAVTGTDELAVLGTAFNTMAERVADALRQMILPGEKARSHRF